MPISAVVGRLTAPRGSGGGAGAKRGADADDRQLRGPLPASGPDAEFPGQIVYWPSRTGVFAPTGWDPRLAERSAQPPAGQLSLEWAWGCYAGHDSKAPCCHVLPGGTEIVYFVAAAAVILDTASTQQRFFLGHDNDILSLALHPRGHVAATGQAGNVPYVCVWKTEKQPRAAKVSVSRALRSLDLGASAGPRSQPEACFR